METSEVSIQAEAEEQVSLWQTVGSVLAAFYGVQSSRAWRRDFSKGNALTFILTGLVMTAAFVGILLGIVKLILRNALA